MFRALAVLRLVVLLNAIGLNLYRADNFAHPAWGVIVVVALAVWTGYAWWAYRAESHRSTMLLILDLVAAIVAIEISPAIKGPEMRATIPGFWVMGALLAWAVHWRWRGGLFAAACLTAADLSVRTVVTQSNYGNIFLLMIGGPIVGFVSELLQRSADARDRAERAAAAAEERTRLARAVHDGVLQVLGLVQRRGHELGGEFATLGDMAGEQEAALRALIRQQDSVSAGKGDTELDLAAALERLRARSPGLVVVTPGVPVLVDGSRGEELLAAVGACLDNVRRHVGEQAGAWVLLEDLGNRVTVSVRDEGTGIPDGRLAEARAEGRLGISDSIRGRIESLGGSAELSTGPHGTDWELTLPR